MFSTPLAAARGSMAEQALRTAFAQRGAQLTAAAVTAAKSGTAAAVPPAVPEAIAGLLSAATTDNAFNALHGASPAH